MPRFAKASLLTVFVMIAMFLIFLQTQFASDIVRLFGISLLPFSLLIFIILTLRTKPERTMKKFIRNTLISCTLPYIILLFAQPLLAILAVVILVVIIITVFGGLGGASDSGRYSDSN